MRRHCQGLMVIIIDFREGYVLHYAAVTDDDFLMDRTGILFNKLCMGRLVCEMRYTG